MVTPSYLAGAYVELAAWAFYDQQIRKVIPKPEGDGPRRSERRFVRYRAYNSGQLFLLHALKRTVLRPKGASPLGDKRVLEVMVALLLVLHTGEKRSNFGLGGLWSSTLHNQEKGRAELLIAYSIIDCLVRVETQNYRKFLAVARARHFVRNNARVSNGFSVSQIEKIWDHYRASAPYIYALFPILYGPELEVPETFATAKITEEMWVERINGCLKRVTLETMFGHAAFAADVLKKTKTRDVRLADFKDIVRKTPATKAITEAEVTILQQFEAEQNSPLP